MADLTFMGVGKVSDLLSDKTLLFRKEILPQSHGEHIVDYILDNKEVERYWFDLTDTAEDLISGIERYSQCKSATLGKQASYFLPDEIFVREYESRFSGYEDKFDYTKKQIAALRDGMVEIGFKKEEEPREYFVSINVLDDLVKEMEAEKFDNFKLKKIDIIDAETLETKTIGPD